MPGRSARSFAGRKAFDEPPDIVILCEIIRYAEEIPGFAGLSLLEELFSEEGGETEDLRVRPDREAVFPGIFFYLFHGGRLGPSAVPAPDQGKLRPRFRGVLFKLQAQVPAR